MNTDRLARLVIDAKNTEFWKEVFIPTYQALHDSLEANAYSTEDMHRRYALVEAVRALRELMIQINDIGSKQLVMKKDESTKIKELDSGHLE